MAIQLRRGNKADLDTTQLKQGEPVVALDTKEFGFKGRENEMIWGVPANRTLAGISLEKDILLSELIAAGVARSDESGNALNALSLGGVGANGYVRNTRETYTLPLINGWAGGDLTLFVFGKIGIVRTGGSVLTGDANTAAAMLPQEIVPVISLWDTSSNLMINTAGNGWAVVPQNTSLPIMRFIVFITR